MSCTSPARLHHSCVHLKWLLFHLPLKWPLLHLYAGVHVHVVLRVEAHHELLLLTHEMRKHSTLFTLLSSSWMHSLQLFTIAKTLNSDDWNHYETYIETFNEAHCCWKSIFYLEQNIEAESLNSKPMAMVARRSLCLSPLVP